MLFSFLFHIVFAQSFIERYTIFLVDHHDVSAARRFLWLQQEKPEALYWIGMLHMEGLWGDKKKGNEFFFKAAKKNYGPAMGALGDSYYSGDGLAQDFSQAFFWYKKAALCRFAPAYFHLGVLYRDGRGVKKSLSKAKYYFQKAFYALPHLRTSIHKIMKEMLSQNVKTTFYTDSM